MAREKDADRSVRDKSGRDADDGADKGPTRAVVIVPVLTRHQHRDDDSSRPRLSRSAEARHDEAVGLARAIDLDPIHTAIVTVNDPRPATLLGSGKVEEFAEIVKQERGGARRRRPSADTGAAAQS